MDILGKCWVSWWISWANVGYHGGYLGQMLGIMVNILGKCQVSWWISWANVRYHGGYLGKCVNILVDIKCISAHIVSCYACIRICIKEKLYYCKTIFVTASNSKSYRTVLNL